jgi:hypothetical protein
MGSSTDVRDWDKLSAEKREPQKAWAGRQGPSQADSASGEEEEQL